MLAKVYRRADEAFLPAALPHYEALREARKLHRWALSVRSSQAFALNLFAPLDPDGVAVVMRALGLPAVDAAEPEFEYEEPTGALAEARPSSTHRTQVDVVLRGHDARGRRLLALVEVKLTETDFGTCSAYQNPANPRRDNCHSPGLFGADPGACFQLNNHGQGRRLYDTYLASTPVNLLMPPHGDGGCLVRTSLSQPMRNLALAQFLLADDQADQVAFALAAPSGYSSIWRRFAELQQAFADTSNRTISALPAEAVAAAQPDGGAALCARYPAPVLDPNWALAEL